MIKIIGEENVIELFKSLNINYVKDYVALFDGINHIDCKDSDYYLDNEAEFENLTKKYGSQIRSRLVADVYITKTDSRGHGLFALNDLKEDDFIGIYLGTVNKAEEMVAYDESGFETDYAWDYPDDREDLPHLEIDAKYYGNEMRFSNHDPNPNLRVEHTIVDNGWYIFFIADRNIKKDEELTISYGEAYWDTEYREMS